MMRLIGALDRSFGNFITLRGLAGIQDLARISVAETDDYQRELKDQHGEAMQRFFNEGTYTFFPEVVLALELPIDEKYTDRINKLYENVPHKSATYDFHSFKIKTTTSKITSQQEARSFEYFQRGIFTLNNVKLKRLDGNHRLSVANEVEDKAIPFCIILIKENTEKTKRVIFNNINFKSIPLTPEENLRLIFEEKNGQPIFTHEELKNPVWFGEDYIQARKLYKSINLENLENIKNILQEQGKDKFTRTFLLELCRIYTETISMENLKTAIQEINQLFNEFPDSAKFGYQLLIVYCYYQFTGKVAVLHQWVKNNHIYEIRQVNPQGLIDIFNKVLEAKRRHIFLAMPFDEKVKQNHIEIQGAIDDLNQALHSDLKLELIRIDKNKTGYSFTITDEILGHIETEGYLIADISLANPNVYYEIGYQMGFNKGSNKKQNNFLLVHNKRVKGANFDKDKHFNISNISIEAAKDSDDLREKVKDQLKKYYEL